MQGEMLYCVCLISLMHPWQRHSGCFRRHVWPLAIFCQSFFTLLVTSTRSAQGHRGLENSFYLMFSQHHNGMNLRGLPLHLLRAALSKSGSKLVSLSSLQRGCQSTSPTHPWHPSRAALPSQPVTPKAVSSGQTQQCRLAGFPSLSSYPALFPKKMKKPVYGTTYLERVFLQPFSTAWGNEIIYPLDVAGNGCYLRRSHFPSFEQG